MTKLTEHFCLEEFTFSHTAVKLRIDNTPSLEVKNNIYLLCANLLEPLRKYLGVSIHISSGYRSPELNKAIGGAKTSQHLIGAAADIHADGYTTTELYLKIKRADPKFLLDQCIEEMVDHTNGGTGGWTHISWHTPNRYEFMIAQDKNGRTVYTKD